MTNIFFHLTRRLSFPKKIMRIAITLAHRPRCLLSGNCTNLVEKYIQGIFACFPYVRMASLSKCHFKRGKNYANCQFQVSIFSICSGVLSFLMAGFKNLKMAFSVLRTSEQSIEFFFGSGVLVQPECFSVLVFSTIQR